MAQHRIEAGPNTVHWGYFDAALPSVTTVASGDTVTISTVSGGRT
jgi:acetamidase/formamidase